MLREHPGIIETAIRLIQHAEDEYNPPNVKVGGAELRWNKEITQFEVVKYVDQDISSEAARQPYSDFIWGRGVLLVPGEALKDPEIGLEVVTLAKTKREFQGGFSGFFGPVVRVDQSAYFKVKLGEQAFFVKKSVATNNPGYYEFVNTRKAEAALIGLEDFGIVQAQLGYEDNHQSWFVSKWENLESDGFFPLDTWRGGTPNDYGKFRRESYTPEDARHYWIEANEVKTSGDAMIKQIQSKLAEVGMVLHDIHFNLFYNPRTRKFFLLDITSGDMDKGIGQPRIY